MSSLRPRSLLASPFLSKPAQTKGRGRHRSVRRFSGDDSRRRSGDLAHELLHGACLLGRMFVAFLADARPLREAHPELRVVIVKMEDALRDLYEPADAVPVQLDGGAEVSSAVPLEAALRHSSSGWARASCADMLLS